MTFYVEAVDLLPENQAGFRAGYSTVDNAFVLYYIVNKYLNMKRKPVYVAFVDFKKAFDSVNHTKLFNVLQKNNIKGNLFNVIKSIYKSVRASVKTNEGGSDMFNCPVGLRQGCSLSPILFSLFINDLYDLLVKHRTKGIQLHPDITEIFMLMFADDVALISDTVIG